MPDRKPLTQDRLKSLISYDPNTGRMEWIVHKTARVWPGMEVRGHSVRGYRRVQIDGHRYKAHDIAWLYMTGSFPADIVDHRDNNPDNLRWANLREATQQQNCHNTSQRRNNTSGFKGVNFHKRSGKWHARVGLNYRRIFVGEFATAEEADAAARSVRAGVHGEFANHGGMSCAPRAAAA